MSVLPVPMKTWQCATVANALHAVNAETNQADLAIGIKNQRVTFGHVIAGSGNGVTAAMDGVDRWSTVADIVGTTRRWVVFTHPGTGAQDLFGHTGNGQNNWHFDHSPGGLFTGGGINAWPTATDHTGPLYVGVDGGLWFSDTGHTGTNPQFVCNLWVSDDLTCCRMSFWFAGINFGNIFYDVPDNPVPGWTSPSYAMIDYTSNIADATQTGRMDYTVWNPPGGAGRFVGRGPHGVMNMAGTAECSFNAGTPSPNLFTHANKIDSKYRPGDGRCGLFVPYSSADGGHHGKVFDFWWCQDRQGAALFTPGDTVPLDGTKQFVIVGDFMLVWNGTAFRIT